MNDVDCKPGVFVVNPTGRVGLVAARDGPADARIVVRFGPDGPHERWSHHALRAATRDDVKLAGLRGVGGRYV